MTDLELDRSLTELISEATRYPGTRRSFLADFALYGFATDVREHASAVQQLSDSSFPRAAFANARAGSESAVDAAFLTSDEALYLHRGAQARVWELYESHELENRAARLNPPLLADALQRMDPEDVIAADALAWDNEAKGMGGILRRAWEAFTKAPGALRKHWSLLSKEQVHRLVFLEREPEKIGEMAQVIHGLLSTAIHPRMRVGSRELEFAEDGGILLGTRQTDAEMARTVATLACALATTALRRRRQFSMDRV